MRAESFNPYHVEKKSLQQEKNGSSKLTRAETANRYVEEKGETIDFGRRKFIAGLLATGATAAIGGKAIETVLEMTKSDDSSAAKTESMPAPETKAERLEKEEVAYVPEDDLTDEEISQIKNLLDFDAPIELNMEKYSLLERSWKNKYSDFSLYKKEFDSAYARMEKYKQELSAYFSKCGVPYEFVYLSIPESYAKSKALSHMKARGPYQFTEETAVDYGLKINGKVDERTDFLKSGKACARFLKDLFKELGDWTLALHAYNGGFSRRYAKKAKAGNEIPSEEGFLEYMEKDIEAIRQEIHAANHIDYKVAEGNTLSGIAKKYSVSYDKLRQYNGIRDPRRLQIGQIIKIPLTAANREFVYNKKVSGRLENIHYGPKCNAAFELVREKQSPTKNTA